MKEKGEFMKIKNSPHPYATVTIIFWSFAYVLTRLILRYLSAFSLGFLRYFIASFVLAIMAIIIKMKLPKRADLKWFFLTGGIGFFLYMIAFNMGCKTVTASTSSIIIATVPIITAFLARFIYHEKLIYFQWIAILIEFIGVFVLTSVDGFCMINTGLFWLILAAVALSSYNLLLRKLAKDYSAMQITTFNIFAGTILLTIFLPTSLKEIQNIPLLQLFNIAVLGIFSSAIAYVSWAKAFIKAKKTTTVTNYMFITPFLTSLLGFLLADEIPDLATILGGVIIITGLIIFNFGNKFINNKTRIID